MTKFSFHVTNQKSSSVMDESRFGDLPGAMCTIFALQIRWDWAQIMRTLINYIQSFILQTIGLAEEDETDCMPHIGSWAQID